MKIGFFDIEGWEVSLIKEAFPDDEVFVTKDGLDKVSSLGRDDFEVISFFVSSRMEGQVFDMLPNLKLITTRSTGFDHIDLEEAKKRGVLVAYVPGYGDNTVAEYAFGLILSLTRKIYLAVDQIKEKGEFSLLGLRGIDIKGKTLGVIGTGRIGKEVVRIAKGFGMGVVAFDVFKDEDFAKKYDFRYVSLEDLLGVSDIITLHCVFNEKTRHLINKDNISLIKKGSYLVNAARGGLVDTDALLEALDKKILAGAALDVLEEEREIKSEFKFVTTGGSRQEELKTMLENHVLMKMPNVLITPHNAFNTEEAVRRILDITIENIKGFIDSEPKNLVE